MQSESIQSTYDVVIFEVCRILKDKKIFTGLKNPVDEWQQQGGDPTDDERENGQPLNDVDLCVENRPFATAE